MLRRTIARLLGRHMPAEARAVSGTIADAILSTDVRSSLTMMAELEDGADAGPHRVARVQLVAFPALSADGRRVVGPWSERWVLDGHGSTHTFTVDFEPSPSGGTDWRVRESVKPATPRSPEG